MEPRKNNEIYDPNDIITPTYSKLFINTGI